MTDPDGEARRLASHTANGDPNGWFEELYAAAERGEAVIPWDRGRPHPMLQWWVDERFRKSFPSAIERRNAELPPTRRIHPSGGPPTANGGGTARAVVVGCGPGHDAGLLDRQGFETTAFDLSSTAVALARRQLRDTDVAVHQADLLDLPERWLSSFDLVVEAMTVQAMPRSLRPRATAAVHGLLASGGILLVIGITLPPDGDPDQGPPWLLTEDDIAAFSDPYTDPMLRHEAPASGGVSTHYLEEFLRW